MPETSKLTPDTEGSTKLDLEAEDATQVTWEDLSLNMLTDDQDNPDLLVGNAQCQGWAPCTCDCHSGAE
jgi:hypothetical protein